MSYQELVKEQDRTWLVDLEALCVPFAERSAWADDEEEEEDRDTPEEDEDDA